MKTLGTQPEVARLRKDAFVVPSASQPGVLHLIRQVKGNLVCSCDGSYYRGTCKHEKAVRTYLGADRDPMTRLGIHLLTGGTVKDFEG